MDRNYISFGEAIEALKKGSIVSRRDWFDKGVFVFMQVPATIEKSIVPKMQSLPQSVKDLFERRFNSEADQINAIYYTNQLAIVNRSNVISGFSPNVHEVLAHDWVVID
jgi:hypothetical protein